VRKGLKGKVRHIGNRFSLHKLVEKENQIDAQNTSPINTAGKLITRECEKPGQEWGPQKNWDGLFGIIQY